VHFHGHDCAAEVSDPEGTCEEVAERQTNADQCIQNTLCCEATDGADTEACTAAGACSGGAPELQDVDCAGGCHLHAECHNGHVHFHGHGCAAEASDPEGTCEEVARRQSEDQCIQNTLCCEATNSTDDAACTAASSCTPQLQDIDCAGDCHLHAECHNGHVHFHGHDCAASVTDPAGTCEEVARMQAEDQCIQNTLCCEATDSADSSACTAADACTSGVVV